MTDVEKCDINVTVGNGHKMKCELKGSVNMKLQYGKTAKLTEVVYVTQALKNQLSVSRLVSKGAKMGATQEKMIINKNGVSMNLDKRKVQKKIMIFNFKEKVYPPEGEETLINLLEKKMEKSDEGMV